MANDRDQELERLEKELLASIQEDDDLLADIPIELLDTTPITWDDEELLQEEDFYNIPEEPENEPEPPADEGEAMKKSTKKTKAAQKREDKWQIGLMITACFLCVSIIGVLIYWLEVFLK